MCVNAILDMKPKTQNKGYLAVANRPRNGGDFTAGDRPKSKSPVCVRLYVDLEERLRIEAEEKGISISQLILDKLDS